MIAIQFDGAVTHGEIAAQAVGAHDKVEIRAILLLLDAINRQSHKTVIGTGACAAALHLAVVNERTDRPILDVTIIANLYDAIALAHIDALIVHERLAAQIFDPCAALRILQTQLTHAPRKIVVVVAPCQNACGQRRFRLSHDHGFTRTIGDRGRQRLIGILPLPVLALIGHTFGAKRCARRRQTFCDLHLAFEVLFPIFIGAVEELLRQSMKRCIDLVLILRRT